MSSSGSTRVSAGITWPLLLPEAPQPGSIASITATSTPALRKCSAVDKPVKPAPITSTSACSAPSTRGSGSPGGVTAAQSEGGQTMLSVSVRVFMGKAGDPWRGENVAHGSGRLRRRQTLPSKPGIWHRQTRALNIIGMVREFETLYHDMPGYFIGQCVLPVEVG